MKRKTVAVALLAALVLVSCGDHENSRAIDGGAKVKNAALAQNASASITLTATRAGSPSVTCSYVVGAATGCELPGVNGPGWTIGASLTATVGGETVEVLGAGQQAVVAPTSTPSPATTLFVVGAACNDNNAATTGDVIDRTGRCVGPNALICSDGNPLTSDVADPQLGCTYLPVPDGTACDDGNPLTSPDLSLGTKCVSGTTSTTKAPPAPTTTKAPAPTTTTTTTTTTLPPTTTTTVNYSGRSFSNANFNNQNLVGANFRGSRVFSSSFQSANLTRADFTSADVSRSIFVRANLTQANFTRAILLGADFTGADLTGVVFIGADLVGARLPLGFNCLASGARRCP